MPSPVPSPVLAHHLWSILGLQRFEASLSAQRCMWPHWGGGMISRPMVTGRARCWVTTGLPGAKDREPQARVVQTLRDVPSI